MPSLATFNCNNFFLRYRFTNTYPGDASNASRVEANLAGLAGYLPGLAFGRYTNRYIVWDPQRRTLAARALAEPDGQFPDIVCFQEVENIQTIRVLNQRYLGDYYPYSLLIDSYDPRNIDVGLLSRFPVREVRSHIDERDNQGDRIFSRDCLEAEVALPGGSTLTLFINHLKSKYVRRRANETDQHYHGRILASHNRRQAQAQAVADYVEARFTAQEHAQTLYAVVGDFNDTPESPYVAPLVNSARLTDLLAEHCPADDRWTYYWRSRGRVSQIDYVLASQALSVRVAAVVSADPTRRPHIERQGIAYRELNSQGQVLPRRARYVHFEDDEVTPLPPGATPDEQVDFRFPRYQEVINNWRANTSDHCPVKIWF